MIVIQATRGPLRLVDVFYPRPQEVDGFAIPRALTQIVHVRQAPVRLFLPRSAALYMPFEALLLDLTRSSDDLFREIDATGRNRLRRAERIRDRIEVHRNDSVAYRDFLQIYNAFVAAKKYTDTISDERLNALRPFTDVLVGYLDDRPVCGHVILRDETLRRVGVLWSASTRFNEESAAIVSSLNRWLHWYEIGLYRSENMRIYDLGRIGTETPEKRGITRFKLSFGGIRVLEHDYIIARPAARAAIRCLYSVRKIRETGFRLAMKGQ